METYSRLNGTTARVIEAPSVMITPVEELLTHEQLRHRQRARIEAWAEDLRTFFGDEAARLVSLELEVDVTDFLMAQRALDGLLEGWRVVHEASYRKWEPETPSMVERVAVEIAPGAYDFVVDDGRQFWVGPGNERLVIDLVTDRDKKEPDSRIRFLIPKDRHIWLKELLPRIRAWIDAHHFLRGQAFNAQGEFIEVKDSVAWEDVILPPELRSSVERNCVQLLRRAALFRSNGVPLRRGIILHGPPGTGKTMIGKALARLCEATFILATPGMLEEAKDVRRVFEWGRRFAPTILFFEDFDLVAGGRHRFSSREVLGEFLSCLDGVDSSEGIIAIATTNDLKTIEPAIKDRPNRFDCVLEVPVMDLERREEFLRRWARARDARADLAAVARRAEGFTGAQLQELCRLAVMESIAQMIEAGQTEAAPATILQEHFERAFKSHPSRPKKKIGFRAQTEHDADTDDADADDAPESAEGE